MNINEMEDYITKNVTYYLRDEKNQPKTAVSILVDSLGHRSRGVSICSPKDQFVKQDGRELAELRAFKALSKKDSFGEIRRPGLLIDPKFYYKCEFMPHLTEFEEKLLEDPKSV
jgi:hypothetical protein